MPASVYIHIPFCKSKCKYCSFVSYDTLDKKRDYLAALSQEIKYYYRNEKLKTLYLGGGTPSLLEIGEVERILSDFKYSENPEITMELNPNDVDESYLKNLKSLGVNRLSIGVQSFDDNILKIIGRRHSSKDVFNVFQSARNTGFNNINLDLIYGLPEQTKENFKRDLKTLVALSPEHISLYGLKIEKNCYFGANPPQNLPDDDLQAEMYLEAKNICTSNGFEHYEISNYSKPKFESKHNMNYWLCGEYYGFGAAAHGYCGNLRYSNFETLSKYMASPIIRENCKILTLQEHLEERIFLGLRLTCGIDAAKINSDFEIDFDKKYQNILAKYLRLGFLQKTQKGYKLSDTPSKNGFLISNIILSEFIE